MTCTSNITAAEYHRLGLVQGVSWANYNFILVHVSSDCILKVDLEDALATQPPASPHTHACAQKISYSSQSMFTHFLQCVAYSLCLLCLRVYLIFFILLVKFLFQNVPVSYQNSLFNITLYITIYDQQKSRETTASVYAHVNICLILS